MLENASVISKQAVSEVPHAADFLKILAHILLPSLLFSECKAEAEFQTQNERNAMN
jgi:hypothetical protein